MKVKRLIELLEKCDPEKDVVFFQPQGYTTDDGTTVQDTPLLYEIRGVQANMRHFVAFHENITLDCLK